MLRLVKKIFSNFLVKIILLLFLIMTVFSFGNGRFVFVKAFSNQINIFPSFFNIDEDDYTRPFWQGINNGFYQDLSSQAEFNEFNFSNSIFLSWEKIQDKNTGINTEQTSAGDNFEPRPELDDGSMNEMSDNIFKEKPVQEEADEIFSDEDTTIEFNLKLDKEVLSDQIENEIKEYENNENGVVEIEDETGENKIKDEVQEDKEDEADKDEYRDFFDLENEETGDQADNQDFLPDTSEEQPIEALPISNTDEIEVNSDDEVSFIQSVKSAIRELTMMWLGLDFFESKTAQAQLNKEAEVFEKNLYFNNFSLPIDYQNNSFTNINLRLSMAGISKNKDDKLVLYYSFLPNEDDCWQLLDTYSLSDVISNKTNGDYFISVLPEGMGADEINNLRIKISYQSLEKPKKDTFASLFIDAIWLEAIYDDDSFDSQSEFIEDKKGKVLGEEDSIIDEKVSLGLNQEDFELNMISNKNSFKTIERPEFNFKFREKKGIVGRIVSSVMSIFRDEYSSLEISAVLKDANNEVLELPNSAIRYFRDGEFELSLERDLRKFKPGKYQIELNIKDKDSVFYATQDFSWGVLALNANKSMYLPGEEAFLQIAVLDDKGNSLCELESLQLEIRRPDGSIDYLSNYNGLLIFNPLCELNNVMDEPDFYAYYLLEDEGYYDITLTAKTENGLREIKDTIEARSDILFEIERIGPTRIYPWSSYGMDINIKANQDFKGIFVDYLPLDFKVMYARNAIKIKDEEELKLVWKVNWKKGQVYHLRYTFDAPNISPEFYTLGPAKLFQDNFEVFSEMRSWQIASDADIGVVVAENISIDSGTSDTVNWTTAATASLADFTGGDKYFIYVSSGFSGSATAVNTDFEIVYGSTSQYTGLVEAPGDAYDAAQISWMDVYDQPSTPVDISLRYRTNSGASYAMNAQIVAINLSDLKTSDWKYASNTIQVEHTGSMVSRASITLDDADGAKDWLVFAMEEVQVDNTAKNYIGEIYDGTNSYMSHSKEGENTDELVPYVLYAPFDAVVASTQFSLRSMDDSTAGVENDHVASKIFALNLDAFGSHKTYYADTATALGAAWTEVGNLNTGSNYAPTASGDQMIFASFINDIGSATGGTDDRLQVNGSTVPTNWSWVQSPVPSRTSNDATDETLHNIFAKTNILSSGYSIDMDAIEIAGTTQVGDEVSMTVFSVAKFSPLSISADDQMESDNTAITNGAWANDSTVKLEASSISNTSSESIYFYYQLLTDSGTFATATSEPSSACASGVAYASCTTKIWTASASTTASAASTTISISSIPDSSAGYKWQVIVFDENNYTSGWRVFNTNSPNFKIDATPPTAPGPLSEQSVTGSTISLNFGSSTSETNFSEYKIFYKQGTNGVTESDTEHIDANLLDINYNSVDSTTINGLQAETNYVINIWAYDVSGQKASSTEISVQTSDTLSTVAQYQYKSDETTKITNNSWTDESEVNLSAIASDVSATTTEVNFYFELLDENGTYKTATTVPASSCSSGTSYAGCSSKIWTVFASSSPWYDEDWDYRKKIVINASQVEANMSDFPVLATTTDSAMSFTSFGGHMASSTGGDIVITDSDAITPLNFEREYYSSSTGEVILWIKTDVSSTTNKILYLYYGNSSASSDMSTTTGVWDSDYIMVQHLNEKSGTHYDSTLNHNDSSLVSVSSQGVDGQIDGSDEFGGTVSGDQIDISTSASLDAVAHLTAQAWVNTNSNAVTNQAIISFRRAINDRAWLYLDDSTNGIRIYNDVDNSNTDVATTYIAPSSGDWHHVVWTMDGTYWKIYIDGIEKGSVSETLDISDIGAGFTTSIGSRSVDDDYQWDGFIDEVRISDINRSVSWLKTEYSNQKDVNSFMTIGQEASTPNAEGVVNITSIPDRGSSTDSTLGYKWQVIACDLNNVCSSWDDFNAIVSNFRIDTTNPSAPGSLTLATTTPTTIQLNLGSASTDSNFAYYKVFYKKGLAGVSVSDSEHTDANFSYINYNGATTTTITGLEAYTQYVINIWAFDYAGNSTPASEIQVTTAQAPHARGRSVMFMAGKYSGNGSSGKLSDTDYNFSSFTFKLAETDVEIKNAYVLFESQFEAYHASSSDYSGYNLAFDICEEPCTADAFNGTDRVLQDDNTSLVYDENGSNQVRLLFDVTDEAQLSAYSGDSAEMEAQVGYRLETGSATSSIANAKALFVVTYAFDDDNSTDFTNTVVYPLGSSDTGDSGSRRSSQSDDCTKNLDCPLFSYNMELPELSSKLSQWFQMYSINDGHGINDANIDVNIETSDVDSDIYIHESANGGEQGNFPAMIFDNLIGFSENTSQYLEFHAESPGTATYYLQGGEVFETYIAPKSASSKIRTVSFPLGVINSGQDVSTASASIDIYFPENGAGSGVVDIKKAWFRIIGNSYDGIAYTVTISSQVGDNSQSSNYIYNLNTGDIVVKPSFNIIHIIPSTDYAELELANASEPKNIIINVTNDSINLGGISAELMITYSYSGESSGYLSSINLFGGQSTDSANSQLSNSGVLKSVLPELRGDKTIRAAGLLSSFLISDSDADMPGAWFSLGSNLALSSPVCTNVFDHRTDSINSFAEFYKDVKSVITVTDNQSYQSCYSNSNISDDSAGAKMNASLLYTYQWDAPPPSFTQTDWRWYENIDALDPSTAKAAEKTSISNVNIGDVLRLRFNLGVSGEILATNTQTFKLQFAEGSDCSVLSSWQDVGGLTDSTAWIGYNNPDPIDGASLSEKLLASSSVSESYEESNPSASNPRSVAMGDYAEWDWAIYNNSATSSSNYCFRMVKGNSDLLDDYLSSSSYPSLVTAPANTSPDNPVSLGQYYNDGSTVISSQSWINENDILLTAKATDPNIDEVISIYFEFIDNSTSFTLDTSEPSSACVSGTAYASCASKYWYLTSPSGDYRNDYFIATSSIVSIPDASGGYKWQTIACDDSGDCSSWVQPGTSPNFYIDTTAPTAPGNLSFSTSTPTSIKLNFGATTTEANFDKYRIYYKLGTSGVIEGDNEHTDTNLNYIDYNGESSTTISNLSANSEYVFNIWAYDLAGNKATATKEVVGTTTSSFNPPSASIVSTAQKTDGSGAIDIVILVDDPDNDDSLKAKLFYEAGSDCTFATPLDPYLDETDENITATYGDPAIDNNQAYQLGTSSGWIITSPGANYVFFDWLTQGDIPSANDTYCLGMVVSDGLFDTATKTRLLLVDNTAPTAPGALTLNDKNYNSIRFNFGAQSSDSRFSEYKIFYKTATSGVNINDTEFNKTDDSNLDYVDYNGATTTIISGLAPNTEYVFNIWAYDSMGNKSSSTEINIKTNAKPTNINAEFQYKSDGFTVISNGSWTDESSVILRASAHDQDSNDLLTFYYELITATGTFTSLTSVPENTCSSGTSYDSCSSNIWAVSTSTSLLPVDWYDADWLYRKKITINANQVYASETDFPILATTTDSSLASFARSDAYDILFTDSSGTSTLAFEREYYDSITGKLIVWIKADISSTTDTVLYMYYGNSAWTSDLSTTTGVWTDNFQGVWHLDEDVVDESSQADAHIDSSWNFNYGYQYGNNEVTARVYQGQYFDGVDDYISISDSSSLDISNAITIDFWLNGSVSQLASSTSFSSVGTNTFVVPDGIVEITVKAWGAGGAGGGGDSGANGGAGGGGGYIEGTIGVTPGETLSIDVGGSGSGGPAGVGRGGAGGGGGGYTAIRRGSTYLFIAGAGGGGGGGDDNSAGIGGAGGAGGGLSGLDGADGGADAPGGAGGSQTAGGAGGDSTTDYDGTDGASLSGGIGGGEASSISGGAGGTNGGGAGGGDSNDGLDMGGGGGGGAGYYGGGGGSNTNDSSPERTSGGGGGSSYAISTAISTTTIAGSGTSAANTTDSDYQSGVGVGGAGGVGVSIGSAGGDGLVVLNYEIPSNIIFKGTDAYRIMLDSNNNLVAGINDQNASTTIDSGWHYITMTYDSNAGGTEEMKMYVDGVKQASLDYATTITNNNDNLIIGQRVDGTFDELTIASVARSESFVKTRFNNLNSVNNFLTISEDSPVTSFYETTLVISLPDNPSHATGYKWQAMACDDDNDCSVWDDYNSNTPNFKVDTIAPTSPGQLNENNKTSNTITLSYGSQTIEDNFVEYKIYYSTSPGVSETDTLISSTSEASLAYIDYNGSSLITVSGLDPVTTYYFNIWAYDIVGHSASSTEMSVTTNAAVSTPGVMFYAKNDQAIYYRVWDGNAWGTEQSSGNLTGTGDNIRHIRTIRSDDGGKVGILFKTWDTVNQEWWATVYRFAADDFVDSTQLGLAYASSDNAQLITGCIGSLSGGEFIIVRNNNGSSGSLLYSWNPIDGWISENSGPDSGAVMNGCELERRPGTDNYLLLTFDEDSDVGSAYYYGGSSYVDNWTIWTQHSSQEEDLDNYVGQAFFDSSDNTRGAISFSNSATNNYAYAKYFICDSDSINYGGQVVSSSTSPADWGDDFVHGEFVSDPGATGIAYFAGRDVGGDLNVYKVDVTSPTIVWSTLANGDNITASGLYSETNDSQKPFAISFYEDGKGVVSWVQATNTTPNYRIISASSASLDASDTAVPGAASNNYTRVKTYNDPNVDEFIGIYESDDIDYSAVFWDGGNDQFYSSGNQAWTELVTSSGAFSVNDEKTSYVFTGYNSAPNAPTDLAQYKTDASTTIINQGWTDEDSVKLAASAIDYDTDEEISLYVQLVANTDDFATTINSLSSACALTVDFASCGSKIWFVASSTGDFSYIPFTATATIENISDSSIGYKWQSIACDDDSSCSAWSKFNTNGPNFKVDTTLPTAPGALTIAAVTSETVTLNFGSESTDDNFDTYKIFYKNATFGVTILDSEHTDSDLSFSNYNGTSNTIVINLASSTDYVFNIWAFDEAGNMATATPEQATSTHAAANLSQVSFLFENDDASDVNSNTSEVSADTALSNINLGERMNVRIQLENNGGDNTASLVYKLQYENQTDTPGTWTDVGASTEISYSYGLSGSNGDAISSSKAASNNNWQDGTWHENSYQTNSYVLPEGYYTEFVFAIETSNALANKTYRLRLYNETGNKTLNEYSLYPSISTIASEIRRHSKASLASLTTDNSDLLYFLDPEGYADVLTDDDVNRDEVMSSSEYSVIMFATKHSNNTDAASSTWNGQSSTSTSIKNVFLQVYRFGTTNAWVTLDTESIAAADTDFDLYASINSSLSEYYDASNWIYWRVYQDSGTQTLKSDYYSINFAPPVPFVDQIHYRWRDDDGTEATAAWRELEDTGNPTLGMALGRGSTTRLRIETVNTGGGNATNYAYRIEYATSSSACSSDPGNWTAVPITATSEHFEMATSSNFSDGDSTLARLNNSESYTFVAGYMIEDPSNTSASISLSENQYTELEYMLYVTNNAIAAQTYCFRVIASGTALDAYSIYPALTLTGSNNTAPYITTDPSDGGSASTSPSNENTNVNFTVTAQDDEGDSYYLAVCQTDSISTGNDSAPVCNGGSWCVSSETVSTNEASCSYTATTTSEINDWYAFVCDRRAGFGVAQCSLSSQGGGNAVNDSPFVINHMPTFTSVSTLNDGKDPGSTFTISTVSSDTDVSYATDTLYLYVCYTDSANFAGCTAGASDTVCSATATSSPNAKCSFNDVAPTPAGAITYYAFVFDSHGLAASANSLSSSYTINNVSPIYGDFVLNDGDDISPNIRGMADASVSIVSSSTVDQNGCTDLVSAVASLYISNATNGSTCTPDDNYCYQITTANCSISDCSGDSDESATVTCTTDIKYHIMPTDSFSENSSLNWLGYMQINDGTNLVASTTFPVDVITSMAIDVVEEVIDFGNNMFAGEDTGSWNATTTLVNSGNSPIDTNVSGSDMISPGYSIPAGYIEYSLNNFVYNNGVDLTSTGATVDIVAPKPIDTSTTSDQLLWGLGIPFGADASSYEGANTFTVILDADDW